MKRFVIYWAIDMEKFHEMSPRIIEAESISHLVGSLGLEGHAAAERRVERYYLFYHSRSHITEIFPDLDREVFDDSMQAHLGAILIEYYIPMREDSHAELADLQSA